jgi:serine/threonine protein kinase
MKQLHIVSISHQDLKPSNVFIFNDRTSKIGDLGRSQCLDIASPHSVEHFTGDNNYAPPEVWFGHQISDWHERSYSVDCYLLGSMITFYLTGLNMNSLMSQNTSQDLEDYFENGETFIATLPYLVETYERAFLMFEELIKDLHIPEKSELVQVVRILCNPIPQQRIHPSNRLVKGNKYDLQIFISILNRIARKAELSIIN